MNNPHSRWSDYRRRRIAFVLLIVGTPALFHGMGFLRDHTAYGWLYPPLGFAWLLSFGIFGFRMAYFGCPKCHQPFFEVSWFAQRCYCCGLPKWEDPSPSSESPAVDSSLFFSRSEVKTFKLHYSEALIRNALGAFSRRVTGRLYLIAIALVFGSFIYSLWTGDRSWRLGVFASVLLLAALFALAFYLVHFRRAITRFRRMSSPEVTFEAREDRFRVTSDLGSSEMSWSAVTEVWQYSEFWLLFFSRAQFITLPLADLDSEGRELILDRAKSYGARIIPRLP